MKRGKDRFKIDNCSTNGMIFKSGLQIYKILNKSKINLEFVLETCNAFQQIKLIKYKKHKLEIIIIRWVYYIRLSSLNTVITGVYTINITSSS